jgi:hypothetical protein
MNWPAVYLGFLIASLMGLAFHAIRGGTLGRLILYLATAWLAFFLGHALSAALGWKAGRLGALHLGPAIAASLIGLVAASLLAGPRRGGPRLPRSE